MISHLCWSQCVLYSPKSGNIYQKKIMIFVFFTLKNWTAASSDKEKREPTYVLCYKNKNKSASITSWNELFYTQIHSVHIPYVKNQFMRDFTVCPMIKCLVKFCPMRIKILDSETQKFSSKFVDQGLKRLKMAYNIVRIELNQLKWWIGMVTLHVTKGHTVEYRKKINRYSFVQL